MANWIPKEIEADIAHLDGIPWHQRKKPHRWHRCTPVTRGWSGFDQIHRCACGAISLGPRLVWMERNSR